MPRSSLPRLALPALMVLSLVNALLLFVHRVMTSGDNLDYLFLAGSILQGDFAEPFQWRFPVGYPFLLAGFAAMSGIHIGVDPVTVSSSGVYAVKLLGVLVAPISALAVWLWLREALCDRRLALLVALLFVSNPAVAPLYSIIGSEPVFLAGSWLAVWAWERARATQGSVRVSWIAAALGATLVAMLFRQIALAIPLGVLAAIVWQWMTGKDRFHVRPAMAALLIAVLGVVMIVLSNASHLEQLAGEPVPSHVAADRLGDKGRLLVDNLVFYGRMLPGRLLPRALGHDGVLSRAGLGWADLPIVWTVLLLAGVGLARCLVRGSAGLGGILYAGIAAVIVLIWPYRDGRFMLPLLPAFWVLVLSGGQWMLEVIRPPGSVMRVVPTLALSLLVAWQLAINTLAGVKNLRFMYEARALPAWHPERYERTGEYAFADHMACGIWLGEHAVPDAVIFAEKSQFIAFASGRKARYLDLYARDILALDGWAGLPEFYAVLDRFPDDAGYGRAKRDFLGLVEAHPEHAFVPVYETPGGARILKRVPAEFNPPPSRRQPDPGLPRTDTDAWGG